jgi:hypothetical protein
LQIPPRCHSLKKTTSALNRREHLVFDNFGRQYQLRVILDNDDLFFVKLKYHEADIGEVKCVRQSPGEMLLADLLIYDEVVRYPSLLVELAAAKCLAPKDENYKLPQKRVRLFSTEISNSLCQK